MIWIQSADFGGIAEPETDIYQNFGGIAEPETDIFQNLGDLATLEGGGDSIPISQYFMDPMIPDSNADFLELMDLDTPAHS